MSEVWMAFECTWEDDYPLGVFSTQEKAEAACSERRVRRIFDKALILDSDKDAAPMFNYYVKPVFIDDDTDRGGTIPLFPEKS